MGDAGVYAIVTGLMKTFLVALIAALTLGSIAEAAPAKKAVHHRPRHSSRVSSSTAEATTSTKTTARAKKKKSGATTKPKTAITAKKHPPSTKPR